MAAWHDSPRTAYPKLILAAAVFLARSGSFPPAAGVRPSPVATTLDGWRAWFFRGLRKSPCRRNCHLQTWTRCVRQPFCDESGVGFPLRRRLVQACSKLLFAIFCWLEHDGKVVTLEK